jgi:uncharacterized membrane protein YwzB
MKRLAALLGILWSLVNLAVAYWMLTGAFVAKTAAKEGPMAQASLLLGGLLIGIFSIVLARQCLRMLAAPDEASGA